MEDIQQMDEVSFFYESVVGYSELKTENLLSIVGPMNVKLEHTAKLLDII